MEPTALTAAITRHRRRQATGAALTGLGVGLTVWTAATPVLTGFDAWVRPDDSWRWAAWSLAAGLSLVLALATGRGLFHRRTAVALAADLDRRAGISGGLLAAGTSFLAQPPTGPSSWMAARTIALAAHTAANLRTWSRISPIPWAWPTAGGAATGIMILASLHDGLQPWLLRAWWPGAATGRPGSLQVTTWPENGLAPIGSEPEVGAILDANAIRVQAELQWADGRHEQRLLEPGSGFSWRMTLPPLTSGVSWRVLADRDGDGRWDGMSDRHTLELAPGFAAPAVRVRVLPPPYSGLPETIASGDTTALSGSDILVHATIPGNGPRLVAATVILENDAAGPPREIPASIENHGSEETTLYARFTAQESLRWGLRLIAAGGREELPDRRWRITTTEDQPPHITLGPTPLVMAADADEMLTLVAEDDVGLDDTALELHLDLSQGPLLTRLTLTGEARRRAGRLTLDLAALGATPGQLLVLVPVASDRAGNHVRGTPSTITVSAPGTGDDLQIASTTRQVDALLDQAQTNLNRLIAAWERTGNAAQDPARHLARARIDAWARALQAALGETTSAMESPHAEAVTKAIAELQTWTTAISEIEPTSLPALLKRQRTALQELRTQGERAATTIIAAAEAAALRRQAASLQADLAWKTKPATGLAAAFRRDADNAVVAATLIEVPEFTDRDFPGELGRTQVHIAYRGLIQVPVAGGRLVVTADDGVRLRIAGVDQLPAEAWHDHPPTPWPSAQLPGGWQRIELDYRQGNGGSQLALAWLDGRPLAATELRAAQAPDGLAGVDASEAPRRSAMIDSLLDRLTRHDAAAAARLAAIRAPAANWTTAALDEVTATAVAVVNGLTPQRTRSTANAALPTRLGALEAGRHLAERDLQRAVAMAAVELRENGDVPNAQALEATLPPTPPATPDGPPLVTPTLTQAIAKIAAAAIGGSGTRAADAGVADTAAETAGRRLATSLARLLEANERVDTIAAYQLLPMAAAVVTPPPRPAPVTDAGWARSRLAPPQMNDVGIDGFRPDQQRAIRQYLDRLRQQRTQQ